MRGRFPGSDGAIIQEAEAMIDTLPFCGTDVESKGLRPVPDNSEALLRLILGLSTNFIILPPDDVDDGIKDVLKAIGDFAVVDRSYVFQFHNDSKTMSRTHEWCQKGIESHMSRNQGIPIERLPWFCEKIRGYEVVHIPDVLRLPSFAEAEKREFNEERVRSLVAVPIMSADSAMGFIGFESCRPDKEWSEKIIALLKIVGEIFAFALSRKKVTDELKQSQSKYRVLFEHANDGIMLIGKGEIADCNTKILSMIGYEREEIIGSPSLNMGSSQSAGAIAQTDIVRREHLALSGTPQFFEWKYFRKDGTLFDAEVSLNRVELGDEVFLQAVIRDITDRKKSEERLEHSFQNLRKTMAGTIQVIAHVVETRDAYTAGHQRRVADIARSIATEMKLSPDMIEGIRMAGVIHDIGKISVPAEILSKPGELRYKEFELIKDHPQTGYDILRDVEFPWPIADIILQHHERMNGTGYPQGLKGDQILLEARIIALSDVVEAIASHRPYRPARGIDAALEEVEKNKGILYDEDAANICLRLFREKGYTIF
jgi:PAS domain S-box-containing protein/putative nucleotidyltransferase with HDIG domain